MTSEALLRQYLLGTLAEDERTRLEDKYFADSDLFQELVGVENDLIDTYVRRQLSPAESQQFESQYLSSPERLARVEFARSLERARHEFRKSAAEKHSNTWKFGLHFFSARYQGLRWAALAASLLIAVSGGWWLFSEKHQSRSARQDAQLVSKPPTPQTGNEINQPSTTGSKIVAHGGSRSTKEADNTNIAALDLSREPVLTFTIQPGTVRGAGSVRNELVLPSNIASVRFQLPVRYDSNAKYTVELQTVEGESIETSSRFTSRKSDGQAVVSFRVPSHRLKPGDYIVRLSGTDASGKSEAIQSYSFRILAP